MVRLCLQQLYLLFKLVSFKFVIVEYLVVLCDVLVGINFMIELISKKAGWIYIIEERCKHGVYSTKVIGKIDDPFLYHHT